jgi:hypothetical protein
MELTTSPSVAPRVPSESPTNWVALSTTNTTTKPFSPDVSPTKTPTIVNIVAGNNSNYSITTITTTNSPTAGPTNPALATGRTAAIPDATIVATTSGPRSLRTPEQTLQGAAVVPTTFTLIKIAVQATDQPTPLPTLNPTSVQVSLDTTDLPTTKITLSPTNSPSQGPTEPPSLDITIKPKPDIPTLEIPAPRSLGTSALEFNAPSAAVVAIINNSSHSSIHLGSIGGSDTIEIASRNLGPSPKEDIANNSFLTNLGISGTSLVFGIFGSFLAIAAYLTARGYNAAFYLAAQTRLAENDVGFDVRFGEKAVFERIASSWANNIGFRLWTGDWYSPDGSLSLQAQSVINARSAVVNTASTVLNAATQTVNLVDRETQTDYPRSIQQAIGATQYGRSSSSWEVQVNKNTLLPIRRRLSSNDGLPNTLSTIETQDARIVDLWGLVTKAQQLSNSNGEKANAIALAIAKVGQLLIEGFIDSKDMKTLAEDLIPALQQQITETDLNLAQLDGTSRLLGTKNLEINKLNSTQFKWDINFIPSGSYDYWISNSKAYLQLLNINKSIYDNHNGAKSQINSVVLDEKYSQYIGSDANEIITIAGGKSTTYAVGGMGGDDVIRISSATLGKDSVVNIFGGSGKNTYLISVDDSWNPLLSTIHIWDFDASKDTIVFTSTNGVNPNIQETKRTIFNSTFNKYNIFQDSQWRLEKTVSQASQGFLGQEYFINMLHDYADYYRNQFGAAEHVLMGEGIPTIVLDETNYNANKPNSLFNSNALRITPSQDIENNILANAVALRVSKTLNTQFSQIDSNSDHDLFKVHLTAGNSYVFTMNHKPDIWGSTVLNTSLVLKDAQGNSIIANSNILSSNKSDGDSRIDYLALKDGDFYLDASGSIPGGINSINNGKYAISAIEIPHLNVTPPSPDGSSYVKEGNFDGLINHLGFKISLTAGDYVDVNFNSYNSSPNMQITDPNGRVVSGWYVQSKSQYVETFLAQNSGDYLFDFTPGDRVTSGLYYSLTTTKNKDIESSKDTDAILSINTVITSKLFNQWDHDWFRVNLEANKKYQFDLHKVSIDSNLDTFLTLRDSEGKQLAFNDDCPNPNGIWNLWNPDSQLIHTAKTSGDYYIDASSFGEQTKGAYTLSYKVI